METDLNSSIPVIVISTHDMFVSVSHGQAREGSTSMSHSGGSNVRIVAFRADSVVTTEHQRLGSEGSRGCGRYGGRGIAGVGGKPVAAEQSQVAGHGRDGRRCEKSHGYCDLAGILAQQGNMQCTQEPSKTCLPGDTSFMQLERETK